MKEKLDKPIEPKIALSIDIEDWYHTPLITGSSFSRFKDVEAFFADWQGRYDFITDATLHVLSVLEEHQIRATFFVVADIVNNYPRIVEALRDSNHEIGCHGLHHNCAIDSKTKAALVPKEQWRSDLALSKEILEKTFGREVCGYRAPGAYFAEWMVPILEELNFKYDSSISCNSLYNKTDMRLEALSSTPYWLRNKERESKILELPWSTLKIFKFILPGGGAFFFRVFGLTFFKILLSRNLRHGDAMFYFHALDIVQEKFPLANFRSRPFYWVNKGEKTLRRLERLFKHFDNLFVPCYDVYERNAKYV
ncbi:MAG: polysaccharide deacetylase family protein [Planctomycetota bacterium]|jgi:peptidoglycan/xylan/chitin deacetylase (PgdA/CDA1 family)